MTLEEYRVRIVEEVKGLRDPDKARSLLAEVNLVLTSSRLTTATSKRFWEELNVDLQVIAEESPRRLERGEGIALTAVVGAAQSAIAQHLEPIGAAKKQSGEM